MDNLPQEKQTLRKNARFIRDNISVDNADLGRVVEVFLDEVKPFKEQSIALYWPYGKEFDCRYLLDELAQRGFRCALPIASKESRIMTFVQWTPEIKMQVGAWGVPEPVGGKVLMPDIVLAPLLAFDPDGYRLGQGGGHYDNTLADLRAQKDVQYIGVGYAEQAVLLKLPREAHDIPLDAMLTPEGLVRF